MSSSKGRRNYPVVRTIVSLVGIGLSFYALHVEMTKESNPDYTAMCDISGSISCSKVFTSKYGKGFGLVAPLLGEDSPLNQPNSISGIVFYCLQIALGFVHSRTASSILLFSSVLSLFGCLYLAYILMFVLEDACLVCISTYVVNAVLFVVNLLWWNSERNSERKVKTRRNKAE